MTPRALALFAHESNALEQHSPRPIHDSDAAPPTLRARRRRELTCARRAACLALRVSGSSSRRCAATSSPFYVFVLLPRLQECAGKSVPHLVPGSARAVYMHFA